MYNAAPLGISVPGKKYLKKAGSAAVSTAKTAAKVAAAPYYFAYKQVMKYLPKLAATLCSVPQNIINVGAKAAGVDAKYVPMFCQAIKINNKAEIKKLLPPMLKIAVKVAASGAAPGVAQTLNTIRAVPGVRLIPGLSFLAGAGDGHLGATSSEEGPSTMALVGILGAVVIGSVWISRK